MLCPSLDNLYKHFHAVLDEVEMFVKAGGKEYGSGYNHTVSGNIEIETNCVDGWTVGNDTEFHPDGAVSIDNVVIDLSDRTITLS